MINLDDSGFDEKPRHNYEKEINDLTNEIWKIFAFAVSIPLVVNLIVYISILLILK